MKRSNPTIGVVGLGPVGSVLAAHLAKHGEDIIIEDIVRDLLDTIHERGLHLSGYATFTAEIKKTACSISDLARLHPDIIFIATKACILKAILPQLKQIYRPGMKIVSLQNGLGNEQLIAEALGTPTTYRVVVNYAGNTVNHGNVKMNWFQPPNYIGAFSHGKYTTDDTTRNLAQIMTASGLKTEEAANVKLHVWEKTILNSALCSICAVTGQTMKAAMEYEHTYDLAVKILEEGLAVAQADGYAFGENALDRFVAYLQKGGDHKPSMLIDVERRRPTEVDFMSGATARYGDKYGIPTPVNTTFTRVLKAIERQYLHS